jgi:hypothetical protein
MTSGAIVHHDWSDKISSQTLLWLIIEPLVSIDEVYKWLYLHGLFFLSIPIIQAHFILTTIH